MSNAFTALQVDELEAESRVMKLGTRVTFVSPDMLAEPRREQLTADEQDQLIVSRS